MNWMNEIPSTKNGVLFEHISSRLNLYLFLARLLSLCKTYISSLPYFFSWQKLYLFLAKLLSLGKTYIFSWLNFFLLAKLVYIFG
jgi:hypothetical protein